MTAKEYQYWVNRLAQYDLRDSPPGSPRDKVYLEMVKAGVPPEDRVAIGKAACKLFEERKPRPVGKVPELAMGYCGQRIESIWVDEAAPVDLRPGKVNWVNPVPVRKWTDLTTHSGRLDDYINQMLNVKKCSPINDAFDDLRKFGNAFIEFNTEGEKQMEKIDWHKPLRAFKTPSHEIVDAKVYTYKSGKQRVVWVDDRVYPVDEQGHALADVDYGAHGVRKGDKIVENVPEEKFFLGLARDPDGTYWLTDGGMVSNMGTMNYWKKLMGDQPHWIVDTREPAEPPKAIEHDPKDWTTIAVTGDYTTSNGMMTEAVAKRRADRYGEQVVRVRTTPPPADTARYIQLWRVKKSDPWRINKRGDGRQEFTWGETQHRGVSPFRCAIKVRD